MKKIYLACPYTHEDPVIMEVRFDKATVAAGKLMADGYNVYSPITHSHLIAIYAELPHDWDYWQEIDSTYITDWADEVWVLMLDGWRESTGVNAEIDIAIAHHKPVRHIND